MMKADVSFCLQLATTAEQQAVQTFQKHAATKRQLYLNDEMTW
jgi:hypothetical protein